ncbi:MAG: DUF366 family protein [Deltaproteobacteria bacterium]|nr:MAG: DUF366 family protein [Deltaproteobacteria bacterium]
MQSRFIDKQIDYNGEQLRSHWAYENFDLLGDSIVSFRGQCGVQLEEMVDLVDRKNNERIYSEDMLHFILEFFHLDLEKAICQQRLLIAILKDELLLRYPEAQIIRRGDDLFDGEKKLTVSIATLSPVSALIHLGININSQNTPVKTAGLDDYNIQPRELARSIMEKFCQEMEGISEARCKVRGVK